MKKKWLLLVSAFALAGCDELIVRDISREKIEVIAPAQNALLDGGEVHFSWEPVEKAEIYRLILTTDGGTSVVDTLLSVNHFVRDSLPSDDYRWRIQAFNSEYNTRPQTFSFRVRNAPDISGKQLTLLAPRPGAEVEETAVTFSWEPLPGAENYRLLVAAPSFKEARRMVADTLLSETPCRLELPDGPYEWRVQALNAESRTEPQTSAFRVRSEPDLNGKTVTIIAPAPKAEIPNPETVFSWEPLPGAKNYRLIVVSPSFDKPVWMAQDTTVEGNHCRLELPDGEYEWRIRAMNETSQTAAQTRSFTVRSGIDLSKKSVSVLAPSSGAEVMEGTVAFAWEALAGAEEYRLTIVFLSAGGDTTLMEDVTIFGMLHRVDLPPGSYRWQIRASNAASQTAVQTYSLTVKATEEP